MLFTVISNKSSFPTTAVNSAFLREDRWDDWGKFRTQFYLVVFDEYGKKYELGDVKIGKRGLLPGPQIDKNQRAPDIPSKFDALDEDFFSLGQSENYYETLNELGEVLKKQILVALKDVAYDLDLFDRFEDEEVMQDSLMRYKSKSEIIKRYHRLSTGDALLTKYNFTYVFPSTQSNSESPIKVDFEVVPNSLPPSNIHVVIGRNGVGKTRCMQNICNAMLSDKTLASDCGELFFQSGLDDDQQFSNLVLVSFSAFDNFNMPSAMGKVSANYIGLRYVDPETDTEIIKTPDLLDLDFVESLAACRNNKRESRWLEAVETLSNDPLFAEHDVSKLLQDREQNWEDYCKRFFHKLSSGHKIVLLTITKLIELVEEKSLVILDEPEGHLHPPLLSAFIRTLSRLLVDRNGVAIVATHSPVVLQEVPRLCSWILHRSGAITNVVRPSIETFGENVAVLTREVFGLEVTTSGFHQLIKDQAFTRGASFDSVLDAFDGQLGDEAKAIAKAITTLGNMQR